MQFIERAVIGATLVIVFGSASTASAQPEPPPDPESAETLADCPPFVKGAKVSTSNVNGGVAFRVTAAASAHVEELRAMLRQLAVFVENQTQQAADSGERTAVELVPLRITVQEIPSGARVTVIGDDVELIRTQAKTVELLWERSQCAQNEKQATRPQVRT